MKLIFLDIDGVMTSNADRKSSHNEGKTYPFSSACVEVLNRILDSTQARIILTSSWRTVFSAEKQDRIFNENGVKQTPKGQTPDLGYDQRSLEIETYLKHRTVENFVILDDMKLEGFDHNFVHINPSDGLTEQYVTRINEILNTDIS